MPTVPKCQSANPHTQLGVEQALVKHVMLPECPQWASRTFTHGEKLPPAIYSITRSYQHPLIFSWSTPADLHLPINFPNTMSWLEGPSHEWIGCDRHTGRICLKVDPFSATASEAQACLPYSGDDTRQWTFLGYCANSEPFRYFRDAGLVPIDRNPDVIWECVDGLYRAWRISTAEIADDVVPDLMVLGGSGMTVWEYEAAVERYMDTAERKAATGNEVDCLLESWLLETQSNSTPDDTPMNHRTEAESSWEACSRESTPDIFNNQPLQKELGAYSPPCSEFYHPDPSPSPVASTASSQNDWSPTPSIASEGNGIPESRFPPPHAPANSLPILPPRQQRLYTIDSFNRNAAATFAGLNRHQRSLCDQEAACTEERRRGRQRTGRTGF
ncbi:MAG: hypothetical protein Q9197_005915 [Variospora fuerteventurae]